MSRFNGGCHVSWLTFHVVLFLILELASCSQYESDNWVNPDDMLNYDRASKTMINEKTRDAKVDLESNEECQVQTKLLQEKLKSCEAVVKKEKVEPSAKPRSTPEPKAEERPSCRDAEAERRYMRRFVNILLRVAGLTELSLDPGVTKQSRIVIDVGADHLSTLQRFSRQAGDVSLGELDDVLSHVLYSSSSDYLVPPGWLERLTHALSSTDALYRLLPVCITLVTLAMLVSRRHVAEIASTILVLVLALGYQWTYDYMIKMAEIRQLAAMHKFEEIPASCRQSSQLSLFEYVVRQFSFDARECDQYFRARHMEPALEVTPTVVLSEMLSSMLLHPAEKLGDSVARFSAAILGGLPGFHNYVVLGLTQAFLAVVVVVAVVLVCGGRLRMPFYLGGLELTGQAVQGSANAPRVAVEEIRPAPRVEPRAATTSDPLVSAMSSTEGLVLMNVPVLERLMSAREDRSRRHGLVEEPRGREARERPGTGDSPPRGVGRPTAAVEGTAPETDRLGAGDSPRRGVARPTAAVEKAAPGTDGQGASDSPRRGVVRLTAAVEGQGAGDERGGECTSLTTCRVCTGAGDAGSASDHALDQTLDETLTDDEGVPARRGPDGSGPIPRSVFIDEIRKLLEEDLAGSRPAPATPCEGLEMLDAENLLQEGVDATEEPARKTSTDSSDTSVDFVKL